MKYIHQSNILTVITDAMVPHGDGASVITILCVIMFSTLCTFILVMLRGGMSHTTRLIYSRDINVRYDVHTFFQ